MNSAEIQELIAALLHALRESRSIPEAQHTDHHAWIAERIARERARRMFWCQMQAHVAKWGAVSVLTAIFYALWLGIEQLLRK